MTVKYQECDECRKYDITGYVECLGAQLCPGCAGIFFMCSPDEVRKELERKLKEQGDDNGCDEQVGIPREVAVERATFWRKQGWTVHFKFTCERCGQRVVLQDANTLYEYGECCFCGHKTKLDTVGFMVIKVMGIKSSESTRGP